MENACDLLVLLLWVCILILLKGKWTVSNRVKMGHAGISPRSPNDMTIMGEVENIYFS